MLSGDLPGNVLYPVMRFEFNPATAVAIVIGIKPATFRRKYPKEHRASYRVAECFDRPWLPGRVFEVENLTTHELYIIVIGSNRLCTCRAGECKRPSCRHRELVQALIAAGAFPLRSHTVTTLDVIPF